MARYFLTSSLRQVRVHREDIRTTIERMTYEPR
jgi:hypothetical protein